MELIPGGLDKPVTLENRKDYVSAYMNYVLNTSVDEPFKAFANGFMNVCNGRVLVGVVKVIGVGGGPLTLLTKELATSALKLCHLIDTYTYMH